MSADVDAFEEAFNCAICQLPMIRTGVQPNVLICGHSLCSFCCDNISEYGPTIRCPHCRAVTARNENDSFATNIALRELYGFAQNQLRRLLASEALLGWREHRDKEQHAVAANSLSIDEYIAQIRASLSDEVREQLQQQFKLQREEDLKTMKKSADYQAATKAISIIEQHLLINYGINCMQDSELSTLHASVQESFKAVSRAATEEKTVSAGESSVSRAGIEEYQVGVGASSSSPKLPSHFDCLLKQASKIDWQSAYGGSVGASFPPDADDDWSKIIAFKELQAITQIRQLEESVIRKEKAVMEKERNCDTIAVGKYIAIQQKNRAEEQLRAAVDASKRREQEIKILEDRLMQEKKKAEDRVRSECMTKRQLQDQLNKTLAENAQLERKMRAEAAAGKRTYDDLASDKNKLEQEKKQSDEAKKMMAEQKKQLDEEKKQLDEEKKQLDEEKKKMDEEKKMMEEAKKKMDEEKKMMEEAKKKMDENWSNDTNVSGGLVTMSRENAKGHCSLLETQLRQSEADRKKLREELEKLRRNFHKELDKKFKKDKERKRNQCIRCLRYNHLWQDCQERPDLGPNARACSRCFQWDHIRRYCKNPPKCHRCGGAHLEEFCLVEEYATGSVSY